MDHDCRLCSSHQQHEKECLSLQCYVGDTTVTPISMEQSILQREHVCINETTMKPAPNNIHHVLPLSSNSSPSPISFHLSSTHVSWPASDPRSSHHCSSTCSTQETAPTGLIPVIIFPKHMTHSLLIEQAHKLVKKIRSQYTWPL